MRKRRFTNVIVAMLVVVGILSSSIEAQAKSFPDVPAGSWFAEYVDYVSNAGLMTGNDRGEFKPLNTFTRGEFATSLYDYLAHQMCSIVPIFLMFQIMFSIARGLYGAPKMVS